MNAPPRPRSAALVDAVARVLRRRRRPLAALAAFLAVFWGISAARTPAPPSVSVVAAARDLPGGTTLRPGDLTRLALPVDAVPGGAVAAPEPLVGRVINGPLSARSVVTEASVSMGADLAGPGHVVLAVPLANQALAAVLQPGSRVDLIAPGEAAALATDVRVVALPRAQQSSFAGSAQPPLLVELPAEAAPRVAQALSNGLVSVALH